MLPKHNLFALGIGLAAAGCGEAASYKAPEIRPVRTMVVDPRPIDNGRSAVGEIKPRYESDLGFRMAGKACAHAGDASAR